MKLTLTIITAITSYLAYSQTPDSVSLSTGYTHESYYSFENGETSNINNQNWDLAFDLSGWGSTIRLNRKNATLYLSPNDVSTWNTLDTSGISSWNQYINGYDFWSEGALDLTADFNDPFDLGWGMYNSITHQINGSKIFILAFGNGEYRKLLIESLSGGVYTFKFAELDNSNEITQTITKSNYTDKNFVYFDLLGNQIIDREPSNTTWDIVFTNYILELAPGYFGGVTSVLQNKNTYISKIENTPTSSATYAAWDTTIASIGYDWKSFNSSTFSYEIVDSLTYFVQTVGGDIWKLVFTDFEGSSTGKIYFTKQQVEFANIFETNIKRLKVFPNPANESISIQNISGLITNAELINSNGQTVISTNDIQSFSTIINTSHLENGIYFLKTESTNHQIITNKIIIQH